MIWQCAASGKAGPSYCVLGGGGGGAGGAGEWGGGGG